MSESEKDRSLKRSELPKRAGVCNSAKLRINVGRKEDLSLKTYISFKRSKGRNLSKILVNI